MAGTVKKRFFKFSNFGITDEMHNTLVNLAAEQDRPMAEIEREAIREYLIKKGFKLK